MFQLGNPENTHISMLRLSYSAEEWHEYEITIKAGKFNTTINAFMQNKDLLAFTTQLKKLYKTLSGEAILLPVEEQFTLKLQGNGSGKIEVTGKAFENACYGNTLAFEFELDQTYLPDCIDSLESLLV